MNKHQAVKQVVDLLAREGNFRVFFSPKQEAKLADGLEQLFHEWQRANQKEVGNDDSNS